MCLILCLFLFIVYLFSDIKDCESVKDEFFVFDEFECCESLIFGDDKDDSGIE